MAQEEALVAPKFEPAVTNRMHQFGKSTAGFLRQRRADTTGLSER
jgi:hypothetical protein